MGVLFYLLENGLYFNKLKTHDLAIARENKIKVLRYFHRAGRPVLLGEISLEIGCSLIRTENTLILLLDDGIISLLSSEELLALGRDVRCQVYKLTGKRDMTIAYDG